MRRGELEGYPSGPAATERAGAAALARIAGARVVLLVEGLSDQIAVEAAGSARGLDLAAMGVVVLPVNGAHALSRSVSDVRDRAPGATLAALCDRREERIARRALAEVEVCDADLEDELIRALGPAAVEELLDAEGDLGAFRTMQRQPAWRGHETSAQLRRFLGSGAGRKLRYAGPLAATAVARDVLPRPLAALLDLVVTPSTRPAAAG